ncbi:MAG: DUF6759 domain-containing protein [Chloroflexota bacterium]|nr:DUF6759 domain-containing protein [Chloroflexota bacterium]
MNKRRLIFISLFLVASLALVAAKPFPIEKGFERMELAQFEIVNTSDQAVTIYLYQADTNKEDGIVSYSRSKNGQYYYLTVGAGERKTFTVHRALYAYTMYVCGGTSVTGTIDLNARGKIIVPKCARYNPNDLPAPKTRLSGVTEEPTVVRFSIENKTDAYAYVSMSGPESYYLTVPTNSTKEFVVEKGSYTYSYWACEESSTSAPFEAYFNSVIELDCP